MKIRSIEPELLQFSMMAHPLEKYAMHTTEISADNEVTFRFGKKAMNWIALITAGLSEVLFAACLQKAKEAGGADAYFWYGGFLISLILSILLLTKAVHSLPIGMAYAVWTGIGAVGTVLLGIFVFKDPANFRKIFSFLR